MKLSIVAVTLDRRNIEQGSGLPAGVAADVQPVITVNSVGQQSVYALLGFRFNTWGFRPMAFFKPELGVSGCKDRLRRSECLSRLFALRAVRPHTSLRVMAQLGNPRAVSKPCDLNHFSGRYSAPSLQLAANQFTLTAGRTGSALLGKSQATRGPAEVKRFQRANCRVHPCWDLFAPRR